MSVRLIPSGDRAIGQQQSSWPLQPSEAFDLLQGAWSFEREVPGQARMRGKATVSARANGTALYHEVAEVHLLDGTSLRAEQKYLFRRSDMGFHVYFVPKWGLFHELTFRNGGGGMLRACAEYLCKQDLYCSTYELRDENSFLVEHRVFGPRKDYRIETRFGRR